jgi:hypothetical protein
MLLFFLGMGSGQTAHHKNLFHGTNAWFRSRMCLIGPRLYLNVFLGSKPQIAKICLKKVE